MANAKAAGTKIKAFTLGDLGVDLVSTPLHVEMGELDSAQNVIFSLDRAKHGLTKRPGMTKVNAVAAAGAALAFQSIPVADPAIAMAANEDRALGRMLYGFSSTFGGSIPNNQTQSADGAAWTQPSGHQCALHANIHGDHALHKGYSLLLPKVGVTYAFEGTYEIFDGSTWADAFTLPNVTISVDTYRPTGIVSSDQDLTNFYLLTIYTKTTGGGGPATCQLLWQVHQTTYAASRLGEGWMTSSPSYGGLIAYSQVGSVCVFENKIWVAGTYTYLAQKARVWRIPPGGSAWTLDLSDYQHETGASYNATTVTLCGHGKQLWCGWQGISASYKGVFRKRDGDVWSTIAVGTSGYDYYAPVFALGDEMYAWFAPPPTGTGLYLYHTTDAGATMTQTATVATNIDPITRAFRWDYDEKIYCVIGNGSTNFQVWELTAPAVVFTNAGTANLDAGLFGAGSGSAPASSYDVGHGDPADPTLPTTPTSVLAKCAAHLVVNASIPAFLETPIAFGATVFDVGPMYSTANPRQLTVPYGGAGYYIVSGQVAWANAAGTREFCAKIVVNGSPVARNFTWGNVLSEYVFCRPSTLVKLVDGDQIQLVVQQVGAGAWTAIGGLSYTFLHVIRIL